jgi:DNA-binding MarR family transcriptional regulator
VTSRRTELLTRLDGALRKVSAQSVLLSDTVARLVGLNSTDLECLDLLYLSGPATAGRLADHTGLTTGATTAVIDRLERAGYVRRTRDTHDRRVVVVEALPAGIRRIEPLYRRLARAMDQLHHEYDDRQLTVVAEYLSRAVDLGATHVAWLQTQRKLRSRSEAALRSGKTALRSSKAALRSRKTALRSSKAALRSSNAGVAQTARSSPRRPTAKSPDEARA